MRKLIQTLITFGVLANQVATPVVRPATASTATPVAVETANFDIKLNTNTASALELTDQRPNFDHDIVMPLKAAQAEKLKAEKEKQAAQEQAAKDAQAAAQAAAQAQARISAAKVSAQNAPAVLSAAAINALGMCESGMTANRNTGNGFFGAFQFSAGTWNSLGTGYARADLAPIGVQIEAVQRLLARSSIWGQFPACASKLAAQGLI